MSSIKRYLLLISLSSIFFTQIKILFAGTVSFSNFESKIEIQSNGTPSSIEFREQAPLTVAFETQIDKSRPLNLKIDQDDKYIIHTWERGVLQSSNNIGKDNWSDVLLFNIDGQFATSPHRVRKNRGAIFFRLIED